MARILVVDDDKEKIRRVFEIASKVPGIQRDDLDVAYTAYDARKLLKTRIYDIVVLDVALPERADLPTAPDAGLALLREICERPGFNKPKHIVGLTAYDDILQRAAPIFERELWVMVQYDPTSVDWSEQLERKFRYIILAAESSELLNYGCDLCVVAALPSPEYSAVLDIPWGWKLLQPENEVSVFHECSFRNGSTSRRAVAGCAPRVGMATAAILATKMILTFRPRYLAMVGITAGLRGTCNIGDVLAADPTWDYGSGKWATKGSETVFEIAPHQIPLQAGLRTRLRLLSEQAEIFDNIRRNWKAPKPDAALKLIIGPVASGAAVRADPSAAPDVKAQHRKTIGIEMEAYGVMAAAHDAPLPEVRAFVMKSVCDFADQTKSDEHQAYAAYTSAATLQVFAEKFLTF
jgi:nucleoside phosphorylase/CheY-like chemotaxis protein